MKKITLLLVCFIGYLSYGQVNINESFDTGTPTGWSGTFANSSQLPCAGSSERDNIFNVGEIANLTTPNIAAGSNGTDLDVQFDYKIVDYDSGTFGASNNPTGPGWGVAELQYSVDDGANWTTFLTIDDGNHVASASCATMMATVPAASLPLGSDVKLQVQVTYASGDYYFYVDNFIALQDLGCTSAVVDSVTVVEDCANSQFTLDVVVSAVNDGTQLNDGTSTYPLTVGTISTGPYPSGTAVTVTVEHSVAACEFDLAEETFACPPSNDDCATAEALTVNTDGTCTITTSGSLAASTESAIDPSCDAGTEWDVWYSFMAPASGNVDFTVTLGTGNPLEYAIFDDCAGTTELFCSDPLNGTSLTGLTPGTTYYLMVWNDGFETPGDFTICVSEPTCTPATVTYTVVDDCANSGGFNIEVDITDMGTATDITVSDDQASSDQTTMTPTVLTFGPYTLGTDVVITVTDDNDANCTQSSSALTQNNCPPVNDMFANATPVTCGMNYTGSTELATLDEDDAPDSTSPNVDLDAPNVWFSYTGTGTPEDVTLNLCPSDYDSSVLVYTGTSGNLTLVAANDDSGTCPGNQSLLTFQSDGTTTYYITVEGWNFASTGNYDMTVSCVAQTPPPANDLCVNAEALTVGTGVTGTTVGATVDIADDNPSCESSFATIVDVFYSFVATDTDMTITTVVGTADQANIAVYTDCTLATQVGCSDANGGEVLELTGLTVSNTYIVRVWNDGVALRPDTAQRIEGDFTITVNVTLSDEEFDQNAAFTYYPNPVKNTLTLSAQNNIENVVMYNMLGQQVLSTAPNAIDSELDMSALQSGTYFVKVTVANTTKTIRVIKQ